MKNVIFKNDKVASKACTPSVSYIGLTLEGETDESVLLDDGAEYTEENSAIGAFKHRDMHGVVLRIERTASGDFIIEKTREV